MRVRVVDIEGTPEELSKADIQALLKHYQAVHGPLDQAQLDRKLPQDIEELLSEIPSSRRATVERFLNEVVGWGDVEARRGTSKKAESGKTRYVRLHRRGSPYGAFAYVRPHRLKVTLRVSKEIAHGKEHAEVRNVNPQNPYQVKIYLKSPEALKEALALARAAYDKLPD